MSNYLYHATYKEHLNSIKKNGLKIDMLCNFEGMCMRNALYFAFNPNAAISYAECSDYCDNAETKPEIIVFKIDLSDLDSTNIGYDWNNRCEYEDDINSIAYFKDVPYNKLTLIDDIEIENTPDYHLSDFKNTSLWYIVGQVFDEEVETNLERGE